MKCLNCGKTVLENGLVLKDGSACLKPGESKKIEYDEEASFVQCQHCNAKNFFASFSKDKGPDKVYFHRYKLV